MTGMDAALMPLRMIGAILLGSETLDPSYSLLGVGLAGVAVRAVLSVIYGVAFAALAGSGAAIVGLATVYGIGLWLLNVYLIAPAAFPWFADANAAVQFVGQSDRRRKQTSQEDDVRSLPSLRESRRQTDHAARAPEADSPKRPR